MHMSHRERFFTALEVEEPDIVPVTDLGLDPPIVEAITGKKLPGFSMIAVFGEDAWNVSLKCREATLDAYLKLDFDAVPVISDYWLQSKRGFYKRISENRFIDEWGRILELRPDIKTTWWVGGTVETEDDMQNYVPPDPEEEGRFEIVEKLVKYLIKKEKDVVIMGLGHSGGWHLGFQVRGGIDKLIIDMFRRPKLAREFLEKIAKTCQAMIKLMIDGGVEVIFLTDDYADNRGPLMNLKMFREFELPNIRKVIELCAKRGIPVLKHSDGNCYPILNDMIEAGIKGFHPIEPGAMDLKDVKQKYGDKICIIGNVDCRHVLPFGSEEDVRKDVRRCIDVAAEGGGYILTSSNSIHSNCKPKNVLTMVNEARKYGIYSLKTFK